MLGNWYSEGEVVVSIPVCSGLKTRERRGRKGNDIPIPPYLVQSPIMPESIES
jgi:hypothetical protein